MYSVVGNPFCSASKHEHESPPGLREKAGPDTRNDLFMRMTHRQLVRFRPEQFRRAIPRLETDWFGGKQDFAPRWKAGWTALVGTLILAGCATQEFTPVLIQRAELWRSPIADGPPGAGQLWPSDAPPIDARAAILIDARSGLTLYQKYADQRTQVANYSETSYGASCSEAGKFGQPRCRCATGHIRGAQQAGNPRRSNLQPAHIALRHDGAE